MDAVKYYSFYEAVTLREAVAHLGADHVRYLASDGDHWARRISNRVRGAWMANNGRSHGAYCALMQAGMVASLKLAGGV